MLALFRLEFRRGELARLRTRLLSLEQHKPAMFTPTAVAGRDPGTLRGTAFKRYKALLDAAVCAYIAYYAWYWEPQGYQVYGDTTQGHMLVPMTEWMRERLAKHMGQLRSTREDGPPSHKDPKE